MSCIGSANNSAVARLSENPGNVVPVQLIDNGIRNNGIYWPKDGSP